MKLEDANKEYNQLFDIIGKAPVNIIQDLINKAETKKTEIESIKSKILQIKNELLDFEQNMSSTALKENIFAYKNLIENKPENELKVIRQKIHNEIKQIVSEIRFHNLDKFFVGDDVSEITNKTFVEALKKRRYKTIQEQENYLLTDAGSRFFNEYERSYTVLFKNGVTKLIKPSEQLVMIFDNRRTKALLEKHKNSLVPS
jgi:Na+/phosphate symporter